MSKPEDVYDADFDAQLQGLFQQAERVMTRRPGDAEPAASSEIQDETQVEPSGSSAPASPDSDKATGPAPKYLQPLLKGMQAVLHATSENNALLRRIDPASSDIADAQKGMLKLIGELRSVSEARNRVSQNMFSALHEELKGYKDGFLLQTVYRPIIRDLITLYDDIAELHRQLVAIAPETSNSSEGKSKSHGVVARVRQVSTNMANNLEFALEVLARLEVAIMPPGPEKLDKLSQKAVSLEPAEAPEEDGVVVRIVKRGFIWKDAVIRPEEVVIKRWKQNSADTPPPAKQ